MGARADARGRLAVATLLTLKAHEWLLVGFWAAVTAAIIALHPARKHVLARPARPDPIIATVAALAVVPAAIYAAQMAAKYRAGFPGDDTTASSTGPSRPPCRWPSSGSWR